MKDDIHKKMIIGGIMSLVGYVIGLVIFVLLGIKQDIFTAIVDNLQDWNMLAMMELFEGYKDNLLKIIFWGSSIFFNVRNYVCN